MGNSQLPSSRETEVLLAEELAEAEELDLSNLLALLAQLHTLVALAGQQVLILPRAAAVVVQ